MCLFFGLCFYYVTFLFDQYRDGIQAPSPKTFLGILDSRFC